MVSSARTRARSSRTSSATTWNFVRTDGSTRPALGGRLDLTHGAGEHRDDAVVVAFADTSLLSRGSTASARVGAGHVEPQTPPSHCPARSPRRDDVPVRSPAVGATDVRAEWPGWPLRDATRPSRICERSTRRGPMSRPRGARAQRVPADVGGNLRPSGGPSHQSAKPNSSLDPCALPRVRAPSILPARGPLRGQLTPVVCTRCSPATRR